MFEPLHTHRHAWSEPVSEPLHDLTCVCGTLQAVLRAWASRSVCEHRHGVFRLSGRCTCGCERFRITGVPSRTGHRSEPHALACRWHGVCSCRCHVATWPCVYPIAGATQLQTMRVPS